MNETELLDEIFDGGKKWKGKFRIWWCDLCDTFSIGCTDKACTGSSCNAHGCKECIEPHNDFNKNAKTNPKEYLNSAEQEVYEKIWWLKKYMRESLLESEYEINWKRMKQQGKLCERSQKIFAAEIEKSFMEGDPDITYGEY
jgi:hypothetical protein